MTIGKIIRNQVFRDKNLVYKNYRGLKFIGCTFEWVNINITDFGGATFRRCEFQDVTFSRCNLQGATFSKCKGNYICLSNCDLSHSVWENSIMDNWATAGVIKGDVEIKYSLFNNRGVL